MTTATSKTRSTKFVLTLARPYLYRRQGVYYLKVRPKGSLTNALCVSLGSTSKAIAMLSAKDILRLTELFQLDNPNAVWEGRGGLRDTVESFANDILRTKVDRWDAHGYGDIYEETIQQLRDIAIMFPLTATQAEAIATTLEAYKRGQLWLQGDLMPLTQMAKELGVDAVPQHVAISSGPQLVVATQISFQTLSEGYLRDHDKNLKKASKDSIQEATRAIVAALEAIGLGSDVSQHTRADLVKVREIIGQTRAISTVNKLIAKLIALLSWGEINGLIPHNYSKGLKITKGARSKRRGFTESQADAVLAAAATHEDPKVLWICSIAAVTGARIQEIVQLTKEDILFDTMGQAAVHINEGEYTGDDDGDEAGTDKSIKTESSQRRIPLVTTSSWFTDLAAFIEHVKGLPAGAEVFHRKRLVDEARLAVRAAVGNDPALVFHSFRHTVAGLLQTNEIILQTSAAIMGHATGSITFDTYGTAMGQQTLREALEKVLPRRESALADS
ncbi:tyrosine-type recombinase/integrase [Pseudomonas sp. PSPC3-3]|uniref:tyrosine-type recombinase/integrase n=1 Tax=unclassified Pseudomonas TaxID=196821 RepID=UPI003CF9DF05